MRATFKMGPPYSLKLAAHAGAQPNKAFKILLHSSTNRYPSIHLHLHTWAVTLVIAVAGFFSPPDCWQAAKSVAREKTQRGHVAVVAPCNPWPGQETMGKQLLFVAPKVNSCTAYKTAQNAVHHRSSHQR
jgi:hypothetical protein